LGGRGIHISQEKRLLILQDIEEAHRSGARWAACAAALGLHVRTLERWHKQQCQGNLEDRRTTIQKAPPAHALTEAERQAVLEVANRPCFRDCSPHQVVPRLADEGVYLASESTYYRILRSAGQQHRRGRIQAPRARPAEQSATGPNQLWAWDITLLPTQVAGQWYRMYLFLDVWSRKIVGWAVHEAEDGQLAADILAAAMRREGAHSGLTLHADNGGAMKGKTMRAKMEALGVVASFSRPYVSDDNAQVEASFRTMKYRPWYPNRPFESLEAARAWVEMFVRWYNYEHLHREIGYLAPAIRHGGCGEEVHAGRREVYEEARKKHPQRWRNKIRTWEAPAVVVMHRRKGERAQKGAGK